LAITTMPRYHHSSEMPDGLQIPTWSWRGRVNYSATGQIPSGDLAIRFSVYQAGAVQ